MRLFFLALMLAVSINLLSCGGGGDGGQAGGQTQVEKSVEVKFSTGDTFDIGVVTDSPYNTDAEIQDLATKVIKMVAPWSQDKAILAKTTPGSIVRWYIPFFSFGELDNRTPVTLHNQQFYDTYVRNGHPEWALHETTSTGCNGRPIVHLQPYIYQSLMDIGSIGSGTTLDTTKYVDRWIKEFLDNYQAKGWDGIFADNTERFRANSNWAALNPDGTITPGVLPCNPRTGNDFTQLEWDTSLLMALERIKQFLDPIGKFAEFNSAGNWWPDYNNTTTPTVQELVDQVYMLQIENFVVDYGAGKLLTFTRWKDQMSAVQDILKNRLANIEIKYPRSVTIDEQFYRDASYLLVKEYNMIIKISYVGYAPWWTTDLGAPLGDMFVVPGTELRERDFERGKVLANPHDTNTYTINLNGTYTDVQTGQKVTSVTLEPNRGVILTLP